MRLSYTKYNKNFLKKSLCLVGTESVKITPIDPNSKTQKKIYLFIAFFLDIWLNDYCVEFISADISCSWRACPWKRPRCTQGSPSCSKCFIWARKFVKNQGKLKFYVMLYTKINLYCISIDVKNCISSKSRIVKRWRDCFDSKNARKDLAVQITDTWNFAHLLQFANR